MLTLDNNLLLKKKELTANDLVMKTMLKGINLVNLLALTTPKSSTNKQLNKTSNSLLNRDMVYRVAQVMLVIQTV